MLKVFTLAAIVAVSSAGCYDDCGCPASIQALSTDSTYRTCAAACTTSCMDCTGMKDCSGEAICSQEATQHSAGCFGITACSDLACKQLVLSFLVKNSQTFTAFGACSNPTVVTADIDAPDSACEELVKAVPTSEEALATSESALTDHIAAAASSAAATTASLAVAAAAGAVMFL